MSTILEKKLVYRKYNKLAESSLKQLKTAAIPTSNAAYEKVLVSLGLNIIQEQIPELMNYFVGTSFLDRSDDGTFAAGFFIFDLSGSICDIPIFLIDGKIKGYQILFMRDANIFLPAESEVVEFILKQQNEKMGSPSYSEHVSRDRSTAMNTRVYSDQNKFLSKTSSFDTNDETVQVLQSILDSEGTDEIKKYAALHKCLPTSAWTELLQFRGAADKLFYMCQESPKLANKVASLIGNDWQNKLADFYRQRREVINSVGPQVRFGESGLKLTKHKVDHKKIACFESLDIYRSDIDRQALVDELTKYGAVFEDYRDSSETKTAMLVQDYSVDYTSPISSGRYNVVMADGSTKEVNVVIARDVIPLSGKQMTSLVISPSEGAVGNVSSNEIAARFVTEDQSFNDQKSTALYDNRKSLKFIKDNVREGTPVVVVMPDGKVTMPLTLKKNKVGNTYNVHSVHVREQGNIFRPDSKVSSTRHFPVVRMINTISIDTTGELNCCRIIDVDESAVLQVPKDSKLLYVGTKESDGDIPAFYNYNVKEINVMPISSLSVDQMRKKASFEARSIVDGFVEIDNSTYRVKDAIYGLMNVGLSKEAAFSVVDQLKGQKQQFFVVDVDTTPEQIASGVKLAFAGSRFRDSFREPSSQEAGSYSELIPVREQNPVRERIGSDNFEYADTSRPPWATENDPYSQPRVMGGDAQEAEDLSESPDSIFENMLFTSMVKHVNPSTERERLVSGLIKCCDSVGRSLFLLYSHGEDFSEAYGINDSDDMENALLTLLEVAGKQLIILFSRSVSVGIDLQMSSFTDA